jgi:hypothetical protein
MAFGIYWCLQVERSGMNLWLVLFNGKTEFSQPEDAQNLPFWASLAVISHPVSPTDLSEGSRSPFVALA